MIGRAAFFIFPQGGIPTQNPVRMIERNATEFRLEFDTPQFLHGLFANDPKNLAYLEVRARRESRHPGGLGAAIGEPEAIARARAVFTDLENAQRKGGRIEARDFRLAVDVAARAGSIGVNDLAECEARRLARPQAGDSPDALAARIRAGHRDP